ncbi:hypothetical protein K1T71_007217 [Dendrolimus kikuchii]|uniref:Uncharacterized protein n=1 Tax=Dendrolimus kikuchii TaxID=765133 RepID=A0ACC1D0V9_9NEOP|nr:hypothetical protein K1T71_007217 [Dendrolimus kikuchii]
MSSDVVTCLQLDKDSSSNVLVVKELNGCDSSFVLSHVLNHCIKNKQAVFVISTHNSVHHYQNVGLKMNYNLDRYIHSDLIEFYNLGEILVQNLILNENTSVQDIFLKLKDRLLVMQQKQEKVNVILDGVSHFFDFHYSLKDVNKFCKKLSDIVTCHNNSFIMYHCNDIADDVTHVFSNLLSHTAHTILEVESLPSGWSTDVSGHLVVKYPGQVFDINHLYLLDCKPSRYLFKLFDRGVKLFAPGTV